MGMFDSIGDAVSSVVKAPAAVADKVSDAAKAVGSGARDAAKAVGHVASEAAKGAANIGKKLGSGIAHVARTGLEQAKKGVRKLADSPVVKAIGNAASDVGKWTWKNKGEIGLWVGTTALLAAIPVTGGASGALAGGLMAGRVGLLGVRAAGAARSAGALAWAGRAALGATKAGRVAMAAQKPLAVAGTAMSGASLVDDVGKLARGKGSWGKVALDVVGLVPGAGMLGKAAASRRAAASGARAAVTLGKADELAGAAKAVAPTVHAAPAARAAQIADDVARGASSGLAKGAPATGDMVDVGNKLDDLAVNARSASATVRADRAADAYADAAAARLARVADDADRLKGDLLTTARRHATLTRRVEVAGTVERRAGTVAQGTGIANNTVKAVDTHNRQAHDSGVFNLGRSFVSIWLGRNAKAHGAP